MVTKFRVVNRSTRPLKLPYKRESDADEATFLMVPAAVEKKLPCKPAFDADAPYMRSNDGPASVFVTEKTPGVVEICLIGDGLSSNALFELFEMGDFQNLISARELEFVPLGACD